MAVWVVTEDPQGGSFCFDLDVTNEMVKEDNEEKDAHLAATGSHNVSKQLNIDLQ